MKKKPKLGDIIFLLSLGDNSVIEGKVIEVVDTPLHPVVNFTFTVMALVNARNKRIHSTSFHLNPRPDENMKWIAGYEPAPAFFSLKELTQYKKDVKKWHRNYHMNVAWYYGMNWVDVMGLNWMIAKSMFMDLIKLIKGE